MEITKIKRRQPPIKTTQIFRFSTFLAYSTGQQIIIDMPQIKKSYFRENLCAEHGIKDG